MAKAMLAAKAKNEDQVTAVEQALGWERLKTLVSEAELAVVNARLSSALSPSDRGKAMIRCSPRSTWCVICT